MWIKMTVIGHLWKSRYPLVKEGAMRTTRILFWLAALMFAAAALSQSACFDPHT